MLPRNCLLKRKEDYDHPNVENKVFRENRESFLDYISEKTVIFIQNTEDFFITIGQTIW
jgi:transcription-repair coupling factor (superfamily II helicase)